MVKTLFYFVTLFYCPMLFYLWRYSLVWCYFTFWCYSTVWCYSFTWRYFTVWRYSIVWCYFYWWCYSVLLYGITLPCGVILLSGVILLCALSLFHIFPTKFNSLHISFPYSLALLGCNFQVIAHLSSRQKRGYWQKFILQLTRNQSIRNYTCTTFVAHIFSCNLLTLT